MPKLSKEAKQRLQQLFKGGQFAIRWGFIPVVLYLGQCRVLKEVQILECPNQLFGVYFGDEGSGGPVVDAADGQSVRRYVHSRG
ncbi:hypothetical protein Nmel_000432 [Mimus melanotis]